MIYSNNRLAIVLWRFAEGMACVPIFSFGNVGILRNPRAVHKEYMEITDEDAAVGFAQKGIHPTLVATMDRPFTMLSCVQMSGVFKVDYLQPAIVKAGELTSESIQRLVSVMDSLIEDCREDQ
jgi:hypothetical protein